MSIFRMTRSRLALVIVALTVLAVVMLGVALSFAGQAQPEQARNVIFMIGDGMGFGAIQLARNVLVGQDKRLWMEVLPEVALVTTFSANSPVTDSAAAATAMATGYKTNNGFVSVSPDGKNLPTLLEAAMAAGKSVGLVATNTVYDATPAAFGAHWGTRGGSEEIAGQLMGKGIDVLLGGGLDQFLPQNVPPGKRKDGRNLVEEAKAGGYQFVADRQGLAAASGPKVLGLFNVSYMNYKIDRETDKTNEPGLVEMATVALKVLSGNPAGFFVMIEGSRIDHAAHAVDLAGVLGEMDEFNQAVKVAIDFVRANPDTLLVVGVDHDTMGLSLSEPFKLDVIRAVKVTPEYMGLKLKKDDKGVFTAESIRSVFAAYASITDVSDAEVQKVQAVSSQASYKVGYEIGAVIGARAKAGYMEPALRAVGETGGHSGNMVPVFATGPQAYLFEGVMDNTDVAKTIAKIAGYKL